MMLEVAPNNEFEFYYCFTALGSGSQPGCLEEVSGLQSNIEFTAFFSSYTSQGAPNHHFSQGRVPPNFFQSYRVQ